MIESILHFLSMGGYGAYVWPAYGVVTVFLATQWVIPWRRWRQYVNRLKHHHESHS